MTCIATFQYQKVILLSYLQRQANCEDVKLFWQTTESEQIDADIHLMGKKMERTIVCKYQFMVAMAIQAVPNFADCDLQIKFGLDQSIMGNKAQCLQNQVSEKEGCTTKYTNLPKVYNNQ